jgi:hypothetical protein
MCDDLYIKYSARAAPVYGASIVIVAGLSAAATIIV